MYNALASRVCEKRALGQSSAAPAASWAPTAGRHPGWPRSWTTNGDAMQGCPTVQGVLEQGGLRNKPETLLEHLISAPPFPKQKS